MSGQNLCLGERKGRALKETAAVVLSIVSNRRDMSALTKYANEYAVSSSMV